MIRVVNQLYIGSFLLLNSNIIRSQIIEQLIHPTSLKAYSILYGFQLLHYLNIRIREIQIDST